MGYKTLFLMFVVAIRQDLILKTVVIRLRMKKTTGCCILANATC